MSTRGDRRGHGCAGRWRSRPRPPSCCWPGCSPPSPRRPVPTSRRPAPRPNALRITVDRLHDQAEAAAEDYGAANDELNDVVTRLTLANEDVDSTQSAADAEARPDRRRGRPAVHERRPGGDLRQRPRGQRHLRRAGPDRLGRLGDPGSDRRQRRCQARRREGSSDGVRPGPPHREASRPGGPPPRRRRPHRVPAGAGRRRPRGRRLPRARPGRARARRGAGGSGGRRRCAAAAASTLPWSSEPVPADSYAAVDRAIAEATANPATPWAVGAITDARALARDAVLRAAAAA